MVLNVVNLGYRHRKFHFIACPQEMRHNVRVTGFITDLELMIGNRYHETEKELDLHKFLPENHRTANTTVLVARVNLLKFGYHGSLRTRRELFAQ